MTEEMPFFESSLWRRIDDAPDPGSFVAFIDEVTVPRFDVLPEALRVLEVNPDCSVLDVGSGTGRFLIELTSSIEGVRAVGIDASQRMVTTATSRAQAAGVAAQFELGDAQRLHFPDESFDRVNCSLVLVHMEDPEAVVAEMARVLTPGGRIVIFEPDADSFMTDEVRLLSDWQRQFVGGLQNPDISRRLQRLVLDNGLDLLDASQVTLGERGPFDYLDDVARLGNVAAEVVHQWRAALKVADLSDRSSGSMVVFRVVATKPPRSTDAQDLTA